MEGLVVLILLVVILLMPIGALILAARANARVRALEDAVRALERCLEPEDGEEPEDKEEPEEPAGDETADSYEAPPSETTALPIEPPPPTPAPQPVVPLPASRAAGRHAVPEPAAGAPTARRLEEQLGTRLPVWIGSVALFLAGAYLVKYTFDAGLLTPRTRVLLGAGFGLLLLAAGEWLRRRLARIAQGVTAAGIADLFASILAALRLYHLVSPPVGFALLGLTAGAAVVLSLRQGPFVALLGLVAGFLTPALIGATEPQPGPLFAYLFALEGGLLVITRRRRWWPLAAMALLGALIWAAVWLLTTYRPDDSPWVGSFLIASIFAFVASTYQPRAAGEPVLPVGVHWLSQAGATAGLVMLGFLVGASSFAVLDWVFLGVLGAATLVLGRIDRRYAPLVVLTVATGLALLAAWGLDLRGFDQTRLGWTCLALGALYGVGGYAAMWRARAPAFWAGLSVAAALAHFLVAYWGIKHLPPGWRWGGISLLLAAGYAVGAAPLIVSRLRKLRSGLAAESGALAALLTGFTVFASLAVPIELKREWLAIAWALEIPALALIMAWLHVPSLRPLAAGLAALVTLRLFQPGVLYYPLGEHPLWNWILYGYGVPAFAFAAGAVLFHRQGAVRLSQALEAGTILFTFALLTMEVRHFFHPENIRASDFTLHEFSTYSTAWLVLGGIALAGARELPRPVLRAAGHLLAISGAAFAILLLCGLYNPLWRPASIGSWPILNQLLYVYGLPAAISLLLSARFFQQSDTPRSRLQAALGFGLLFALIGLEVRQWFLGENLGTPTISVTECATYANVWLVLGGVALLVGRIWQRAVMRVGGHITSFVGTAVAVVVLCGFLNPLWVSERLGTLPILNDLLYVYGLPALLSLLLATRTFEHDEPLPGQTHAAAGVSLVAMLVSLEIRHGFHGEPLRGSILLTEWATYFSAWIVLGGLSLLTAHYWQRAVLSAAGHVLHAAGLLVGVLVLGLIENPFWRHHSVGTTVVFNALLYIYGLPAVLAAASALHCRRLGELAAARLAAVVSLLLVFSLVSLEVRQWFRGEFLDGGWPAGAESYAYSTAWVALGTLLLLIGIVTRGLTLRWASLAVMMLAACKVFLFDTAHLRDLYRVFSLLGLGVSLLLLAFLYQRFVFRDRLLAGPAAGSPCGGERG